MNFINTMRPGLWLLESWVRGHSALKVFLTPWMSFSDTASSLALMFWVILNKPHLTLASRRNGDPIQLTPHRVADQLVLNPHPH